MRARSGDLERSPRTFLPAQVGEVRCECVLDRARVDRLERRRVDPAAQILDDFVEMRHRHRVDPCQRGLGRRLRRTDETRQPCTERTFGDGERAGNRADAPVQGELADGGVLGQALGRDLPRRPEHGERDRQVEPRPLLAQRGRREVDGDAPVDRPLEGGGDDATADAVLRLLAGTVGEPDDRKAGDARLEVRLDLDATRLEPDESLSHCAREHCARMPGRRSHVVTVFPERQLQVCYGV